MPDEVAVKVVDATKRFGSVSALRCVSLDILRGEFMTLLGPSGCGKTTLLNLVAGYLDLTEGEIYLGGIRITEIPPFRRHVGMVFQNYALFPHMNVAQNVAYGLKMRRISRVEIRRRVAEALEVVKLTGFEQRRPRELSGGQQQRVALARAVVIDPVVLLLDEPLSALDKNLRTSMQIELKDIQRRLGITTIFVTHDQGEALSLSDRIAVMAEGEIQQVGTPEDIYRSPQTPFVASFVGEVNRLPGRLEHMADGAGTFGLPGGHIDIPLENFTDLAVGADVEIFVRPEHLYIPDAPAQGALTGTVEHHVYQGSHVDMYVGGIGPNHRNLHLRIADAGAIGRWPIGTRVAIAINPGEARVFPRQA